MPDPKPTKPKFDHLVAPDTDHKYGKSGGKTRTFTLLDNPDLDSAGVARYRLYEATKSGYEIVLPNGTSEEVDAFVTKNGQWEL